MEELKIIDGAEGLVINQLLSEKKRQILFILDSNEKINAVSEAVSFFNPQIDVVTFKPWDILPYEITSPTTEVLSLRIKTLVDLILKDPKPQLIISSIESLTQRLPPREFISKYSLPISLGDNLSRELLQGMLVESGYNRMVNAVYPGEFAVRGGVIDVVLDVSNKGVRIDFFGNIVESIRLYDTDSQLSEKRIQCVTLYPASELLINNVTVEKFKENYQRKFGLISDPLYNAVSEYRRYAGCENWLPLFYEKTETLIDYISSDSLVILPHDFANRIKIRLDEVNKNYQARLSSTSTKEKVCRSLIPDELYASCEEIEERISTLTISKGLFERVRDKKTSRVLKNYQNISQLEKKNVIDLLRKDIKDDFKNKFLICCFSTGSRERLEHIFGEHEVAYQRLSNFAELESLPKDICGIAICPIDQGFIYLNTTIISEKDLFGERFVLNRKIKRLKAEIFNELGSISPGEIVVHAEHGIGRFEGLETLKVMHATRDFVKLTYADEDRLYLPVENLELITRYGSGEAALDKLGGVAWQARKSRLKKRIKIAAEQMLRVAAERILKEGEVIQPVSESYEVFCNQFPYVETRDQLNAIEDVISDLSSGKPMDRLVCGDVGFGKTEVALRAAFLAVCNTHPCQVAVLVPTTLLARQHFQTFINRFRTLPVQIRQLSKFTPPKEAKTIKQDITEGKVDIVIGTHALLSKGLKFRNLGMLIIDEEQHFGVAQKERLKELRTNCHVLTLSATPIPRTLQMSLSGIRDLSLITTPPIDRLPIRTHVMPFDRLTIREAVLREVYRGGRVFYVTPKIKYIDSLVEEMTKLLPEIKIISAHGQVSANRLDGIMNDFFDGKYQMLISTTIVESGLDISNANTIIIDRAHLFGLSQLYQIRGRVGRSNTQAYAYLTYPPGLKLNALAEKRLSILRSMDYLGAGFSVASHDMDIRGYGNILGDEQSGHIKEVGIELYQQMLKEAVAQIKMLKDEPQDKEWSPIFNIGVSIQIPEHYIPDISLRLSLYRKIANLEDEVEVEKLAEEVTDRFGKLPDQADHLFTIVKLKQLAKKANIVKVDLGEKGLLINFRGGQPANVSKVMSFIAGNPLKVKLRSDNRLFIEETSERKPEEILKNLLKILQHLSNP